MSLSARTLARLALLPALLFAALPALAHLGLDEQIADITLRIQRAPTDAALYLRRGELRRQHGDRAAALKDCRRARDLDPLLAAADLCEGRLLLDGGDFETARLRLDRFLARRSAHVEGLLLRGRALARLGDPLSAARDFASAIDAAPEPEPAHYLECAQALEAAGPERLDEALAVLDKGMIRVGAAAPLVLAAIDMETRLGRHEAALARLERSRAVAERQEGWLLRRGEILASVGRAPEARRAYASALAALASLPAARRSAAATRDLESRLRAELDRLPPAPPLESAAVAP